MIWAAVCLLVVLYVALALSVARWLGELLHEASEQELER